MARFRALSRSVSWVAIAWAVAAEGAHAQSAQATVGASATVVSAVAIVSSRGVAGPAGAERRGTMSAVFVTSPAPHVVAAFEGDWSWAKGFTAVRAGALDAIPREVQVRASHVEGRVGPARITYVVAVVL